jgi:DNA-binding CsgD family transcriptional regulator
MEALLKGMELIDQVEEPAQLPQLFADGCARAIPCANVSFNLIDRRLEGLHVARSRGVQVPTEEDSPLLRNLKEHPMIMRILCEDSLEIMAFSDFYSRRQFHRTCLYNEYYRRSDTQQQICFQVGRNADDYAIVAVNHVSGSAFSEADRQLAAILQRHLASVYRRVGLMARYRAGARGMEAAVRLCGLVPLLLDHHNRPIGSSSEAQRLLRKFFGMGFSASGELPSALSSWVRAGGNPYAGMEARLREPLRIAGPDGFLEVTFRPGCETLLPLLLLRELPDPGAIRRRAIDRFQQLGLTVREGEVLFWIAEGKTNPEIAILLTISPRTVHKHTEHIFHKLRVENRHGALLRARMEMGRDIGPPMAGLLYPNCTENAPS